MDKKEKYGKALVMAVIFIIARGVINMIWRFHTEGAKLSSLMNYGDFGVTGVSAFLMILCIVFGFSVGLTALFIAFATDDSHIAPKAKVPWAIFGFLSALLEKTILSFLPKANEPLIDKFAESLVWFLTLGVAYLFAFKILPLLDKKRTS